jgi:hypothetical protein
MDRAALLDELAHAFTGVKRDPEQSLHQAQLTDQGMRRRITDAEWRAAGQLDSEESWERVPATALDECDSALSHFTPESWRFYLPAYMRRALACFVPPAYSYKQLSSVLFHLTYRPDGSSYLLQRFELLDGRQRMAVRHFLEVVECEALALVEATNGHWWAFEDAKAGLDCYWREVGGEP